jgi:hypothetical protein
LVGLSPAKDSRNLRFLDDLYKNGVVEHRIFSFFITNYFEAIAQITDPNYNPAPEDLAKGSKLVIGGYNLTEFTTPGQDEIYWLKRSVS